MKDSAAPAGERELVISRVIDAPREAVYRCWTEPELMTQWFAPRPWTTPRVETDVRPGGSILIVMRSPEGQEFPSPGVYLEVVPNERLVTTDAYSSAWHPSEKPFFTAILTFEDAGPGKTLYTARARHWTKEAYEQHKAMGFETGWMTCAAQLEEVARRL